MPKDNNEGNNKKAESKKCLTLDLAIMIPIFTVLLYLMGASYVYNYYAMFLVAPLSLEIPFENFYFYAFLTVKDNIIIFGSVFCFVFIYVFFGDKLHDFLSKTVFSDKKKKVFLLCSLALFLICGSYGLGRYNAVYKYEKQKNEGYEAHYNVKIWLAGGTNSDGSVNKNKTKQEALLSGCYKLLLQNKDKVYLFRPRSGVKTAQLPLWVIPIKDIALMEEIKGYACKY
ncbi:MAG: hypothetical protein L3V56_14875 [Candidatus Magnetoovum sp. WYHC-5]|nr:hypothetical protein [Candidatus Magnetoovum sp. WYHC-5]